jgi:hypothetical protein
MCSVAGQPLQADSLCIIENFLLSAESPLQYWYSTLSLASVFSFSMADFLLAGGNEMVVVQIRDGVASLLQSNWHRACIHFPPSSLVEPRPTFVIVNVDPPDGCLIKDALAKALVPIHGPEDCFAVAVDNGRVCALAQRFWDGALLSWRQLFQQLPQDSDSVAGMSVGELVILKRSK